MGTKKRTDKKRASGRISPEIRYWGPGYEDVQRQLDAGADPSKLQDLGYPVESDGGPDDSVVQFRRQREADRPRPRVANEPEEDPGPPPEEPLYLQFPDTYVEVDEEGNELRLPGIDEADADVIAIDADVAFAPSPEEKRLAQGRHPSTHVNPEGT